MHCRWVFLDQRKKEEKTFLRMPSTDNVMEENSHMVNKISGSDPIFPLYDESRI
jgi:hypothetical protein